MELTAADAGSVFETEQRFGKDVRMFPAQSDHAVTIAAGDTMDEVRSCELG